MMLISIPIVIAEVFGWIRGDFMAKEHSGPSPPPPAPHPHMVILSVQRGTGISNLSATSSGCRRTPNTPQRRITGHYPALNQTAQAGFPVWLLRLSTNHRSEQRGPGAFKVRAGRFGLEITKKLPLVCCGRPSREVCVRNLQITRLFILYQQMPQSLVISS